MPTGSAYITNGVVLQGHWAVQLTFTLLGYFSRSCNVPSLSWRWLRRQRGLVVLHWEPQRAIVRATTSAAQQLLVSHARRTAIGSRSHKFYYTTNEARGAPIGPSARRGRRRQRAQHRSKKISSPAARWGPTHPVIGVGFGVKPTPLETGQDALPKASHARSRTSWEKMPIRPKRLTPAPQPPKHPTRPPTSRSDRLCRPQCARCLH